MADRSAAHDWRKPYRTMDASGEPGTAGAVAWDWIEERAAEAKILYGELALVIDTQNFVGGSGVIILYRGTSPIAVATVFRDPLNWSILVRWVP